jgi:hypothetical protein
MVDLFGRVPVRIRQKQSALVVLPGWGSSGLSNSDEGLSAYLGDEVPNITVLVHGEPRTVWRTSNYREAHYQSCLRKGIYHLY